MSRFSLLILSLLLTIGLVYAEDAIKAGDKASILRYELGIEIDPDSHSFSAKASMEVEANGIDEVSFAFNKELVINRLTVNEKATNFTRRGNELAVSLPDHEGGNPFRIDVEYGGVTQNEEGGFKWSHIGDATYMIYESLWYPTIHGVRAPARLEIVVPAGYTAISSGELVGLEEKGDKTLYRWEDSMPVYGISFAVGKFRIKAMDFVAKKQPPTDSKPEVALRKPGEFPGVEALRKNDQLIRISCYVFEKDFYLADDCLRLSKGMLEFYVSRFGGYPFNRFSVVEMPEDFFGGHGDQGFILLQSDVLRAGSEEFIAHEIAHAWWGALISAEGGYNLLPFLGVRLQSLREPSKNQWLNEGFATYSAMMFLENKYSRERVLRSLKEARREYLRVEKDTPIFRAKEDIDSTDYRAIVYGKGAFVLHMLRYVVGEDAFDKIIDTYIQRFKGKSATIDAFEKVSEEVYGNLSWFFDSWIKTTALPDYAVDKVSVERCGGSYCTKVEVLQMGDVIKMPLDVSIRTSTGLESKRVWIEGKKAYVEFVSISAPEAVELDPDYWVLEKERANNIKALDHFSIAGLKALVDSFLRRFD